MNYRPRTQAVVVEYISKRFDELEPYYDAPNLYGEKIDLKPILRDCVKNVVPFMLSTRTLRWWWDTYLMRGRILTEAERLILLGIVEQNVYILLF